MTAAVIDGRKASTELARVVRAELDELVADGGQCGLATVRVGDDFGSAMYERRLERVGCGLGVPVRQVRLPDTATEADLLDVVRALNGDGDVTGILLLRPLPARISEARVFGALDPGKDVEAVHPENAGLLALGTPRFVPSTAASVFYLLDDWLDQTGEDRAEFYRRALITVVGRSNNVGKPAVALASARQAAVQSVDEWASRSGMLGWYTRRSDVVIVAAGRPGLIRAEHVSADAIVIDVGINPSTDEDGTVRVVGDVAYDSVLDRARALTPVPGGVGPITDLWLLRNTVAAGRRRRRGVAPRPIGGAA
ncbi:bifunctional 5,10-methylenetetrahydrofolate dehydrogenase/5,10-methenyltetrahydrofolate cyclohydrolase [Nocardioides humi]|uniref:Bifunctional protein FolD n=1 Tax=Nocardioides humi TaxID=449461 RepID=A0ABN1ZZN4_9ACTN|nr:bifunctional 5,10-methylenetetrahydrofolate dehydrogenase/5,10-methenyltetrahydrofolate cyclohydrolase [Nocardioides humi]